MEDINDIIYAVDRSGHVTYIGPAVEDAGGYSPSEVVGRSFRDFVYADDMSLAIEAFRRTIAGKPEPTEYRMLSKSGEAHWMRSFDRPILEGDEVVGVRGVLTDIAESKRMEEKLQETREELEAKVERQMLRRNSYGLPFRELTVLNLVAVGRSDMEIASELSVSPLTVQKHLPNILAKMEASSRTEASVRVVRERVLD